MTPKEQQRIKQLNRKRSHQRNWSAGRPERENREESEKGASNTTEDINETKAFRQETVPLKPTVKNNKVNKSASKSVHQLLTSLVVSQPINEPYACLNKVSLFAEGFFDDELLRRLSARSDVWTCQITSFLQSSGHPPQWIHHLPIRSRLPVMFRTAASLGSFLQILQPVNPTRLNLLLLL